MPERVPLPSELSRIIELYDSLCRDNLKTSRVLAEEGIHITPRTVQRVYEIIKVYNRYGGSARLAAKSMSFSDSTIRLYWQLAKQAGLIVKN